MKLVFVRHGITNWASKFTGWRDESHVTSEGIAQIQYYASLLGKTNIKFDLCFSSRLHRAIKTAWVVLETIDQLWIPHEKAWQLNERHYGALQGLDKKAAVAKYGEEKVHNWRRGFDTPPPLLDYFDPSHPRFDRMYADVDPKLLPRGESLQNVYDRAVPYFDQTILPLLKTGKNILLSGNGNAMRALMMRLESLSKEQVENLNIPYCVPLIYDFDGNMQLISKKYLASDEEIALQLQQIKNQTSI